MKSSQLNPFILISLFIPVFSMVSCDINEVQRNVDHPESTIPITNRSIDDCEDCPVDYCCCEIELVLPNSISQVTFCGAYLATTGTPCGPYNPGSPCSTISGSSASQFFSGSSDRYLFCAPTGGSFCIQNVSGHTISIRFSCQYNQTNPDEENITLTNNQIACFNNNGSCELTECN